MANVFLIHWNKPEAEAMKASLMSQGFNTYYEAFDGRRAFKLIVRHQPDAVVIYLRRQPSRGLEVVDSLKFNRKTSRIPILFVDGNPDTIESIQSKTDEVYFIRENELTDTLKWIILK